MESKIDRFMKWLDGQPVTHQKFSEFETLEIEKREIAANRQTHNFVTCDGINYNCAYCDCKPWHKAANRPCE
jgi:hypothetical protein